MNLDPSFDFNLDLEDVAKDRVAQLFLNCNGDGEYIIMPDGLEIDLSEEREEIARQDGETSRGADTIGAAVISRPMSSGQPEIMTDQREILAQIYKRKVVDFSNVFGCDQSLGSMPSSWPSKALSLMLLFIFSLLLRQKSIHARKES
jgi:hypothetical protein